MLVPASVLHASYGSCRVLLAARGRAIGPDTSWGLSSRPSVCKDTSEQPKRCLWLYAPLQAVRTHLTQ